MTFYPLTINTWGREEFNAVVEVVQSGNLTMGKKVQQFEEAFAAYHGRRYGIMTNSGSSANLIAVASLFYADRENSNFDIHPGGEIIVPGVAWSTTYSPFHQYRANLKIVDVEADTLNIDPTLVKAAINQATTAVAVVNILGNPADLDVLEALCREHGLILFEDNCESLGAKLNERLTGTFGHTSTFSFFYSHQISTIEGGMILTDDEDLNSLSRSLRAHGWSRDNQNGAPAPGKFYEEYRFLYPGYNVRPQEINAAVGLVQLEKLREFNEIRRNNLRCFNNKFSGSKYFRIQRENGISSSFSFPIILEHEIFNHGGRDYVFGCLRDAGIEFRMITGGSFLSHPTAKHYRFELASGMLNSELVHHRGFFVGNYPRDLTQQITVLHEVLEEAVEGLYRYDGAGS